MKIIGTYKDPKTGRTGDIVAETEHYYVVKWHKSLGYDYEQVVKEEYSQEYSIDKTDDERKLFNKRVANLIKLNERQQDREVLKSVGGPELSFEVSESEYHLDRIIRAVENLYPEYKFNRTEARYDSCVIAIFERRTY